MRPTTCFSLRACMCLVSPPSRSQPQESGLKLKGSFTLLEKVVACTGQISPQSCLFPTVGLLSQSGGKESSTGTKTYPYWNVCDSLLHRKVIPSVKANSRATHDRVGAFQSKGNLQCNPMQIYLEVNSINGIYSLINVFV